MRGGALRHRIIIQDKTVTQNEYGEEEATWKTFLQAWASITPIMGREFLEARAQGQELSHKVELRARKGVTPEMRVKFGDRIFDIEAVMDVEEKGAEMVLMCKELV